jgi:RNA polymerase sigma-70 factor, ECF subfamily
MQEGRKTRSNDSLLDRLESAGCGRSRCLGLIRQRLTRTDVDAEDLLQEAYLAALHRLDDLQGRIDFIRPWFLMILRYVINNAGRKYRRRHGKPLQWDRDSPPQLSDEPSPEESLLARERMQVILSEIDRLPVTEAAVFRDVELYGMRSIEAAGELGIAPREAIWRLQRARAILRAHLRGEVPG